MRCIWRLPESMRGVYRRALSGIMACVELEEHLAPWYDYASVTDFPQCQQCICLEEITLAED